MTYDAKRYLDLISSHLLEHHASLFVGSGFSRNAIKVNADIKDPPLWDDLAQRFIVKLAPDGEISEELKRSDPLTLAEQVEITYGRPELDRLLLTTIRDSDYRPSQSHLKLLQLPWSDIFTTNYDTLLERASAELAERRFSVIQDKGDLPGSAGTARIIKLHGSFPSQRPFIITSEDYRTYPQKFAPFVNTVQQSLLENTLCIIGFSGDDPNFNSWIGWIRDNLGIENTPRMYLLLHHSPSEARREWLRRRNIIAVDLSELFSDEQSPSAIYEKALDYLLKQYHEFERLRISWKFSAPEYHLRQATPIAQALPALKESHRSCPNLLTLPFEKLSYLRDVVMRNASMILHDHCRQENPDPSLELDYLYEYDWLNTRALLPITDSDLKYYQVILARHNENHGEQKFSILLSLLRTFRERSAWTEWESVYRELSSPRNVLSPQQCHQLKWEECLYFLFRYEFQNLKKHLDDWDVSPDLPLWSLRKAGLLAEYGDCERAHSLLQQAILNIRKHLINQLKPNLYYLSLESAMMYLQSFLSQAISWSSAIGDTSSKEDFIDVQHQAHHRQYQVSWEDQNAFYTSRMATAWEPSSNRQISSCFDFEKETTSILEPSKDTNLTLAFAFLQFREETGIPFRIRSVVSGNKAASGAAKRVAQYEPQRAIHLLVRADEPRDVESVITRGILSSLTQKDSDFICRFYLNAVRRTEDELSSEDCFYRNSFARLAADVLPEVLSELCCKCSISVLEELLSLLETLYSSSKRSCYQYTRSLAQRLISAFPLSKRAELRFRLLQFPLTSSEASREFRHFPDPLDFLVLPSSNLSKPDKPLSVTQKLLDTPLTDDNRNIVIDRLLHCHNLSLLTQSQEDSLSRLLWTSGKFNIPNGWLRTICLNLPAPECVDCSQYISSLLTSEVSGYLDGKNGPKNDVTILREIVVFSLYAEKSFSNEQISSILVAFDARMTSLSKNVLGPDFFGVNSLSRSLMYQSSNMLWILTSRPTDWTPTDNDSLAMEHILNACSSVDVYHYGLCSAWQSLLNHPATKEQDLASCLRSTDINRVIYGYHALALSVEQPTIRLLNDNEIRSGIVVMAQHIAWCIPKGLESALQTTSIIAEQRPELLENTLEVILSGLRQLLLQSTITKDDSISSAAEKGRIRKAAAALSSVLKGSNLDGASSEVLESWQKVIHNPNEFSEIRNAESSVSL